MPNKVGQAYTFMTLTAILPGHSEELREYVESLPLGLESPFARLEQVHFARFVIIPQLIDLGPPPAERDQLKNEYLLFSSDFDGELEPFLEALRTTIAEETASVWGHCVGFPGTGDAEAFARYMRHNQIDTDLPFAAYPDATVADARRALALRDRLAAFALEGQELDAASLQQAFREEFGP